MLIGRYEPQLDPTGRLAIPTRFRDELDAGMVITRGADRCLYIFPLHTWQRIASDLDRLPLNDPAARQARRIAFSAAEPAEMDGKGRVAFPPGLRHYAHLDGPVVAVGMHSYIEVWDSVLWAALEAQTEEWEAPTAASPRSVSLPLEPVAAERRLATSRQPAADNTWLVRAARTPQPRSKTHSGKRTAVGTMRARHTMLQRAAMRLDMLSGLPEQRPGGYGHAAPDATAGPSAASSRPFGSLLRDVDAADELIASVLVSPAQRRECAAPWRGHPLQVLPPAAIPLSAGLVSHDAADPTAAWSLARS
ncbi:MAG TPA: division/cell wall cluster transcriptional repressor MraZ [Chloroflexia bacterium]|nr:division/cell wall cluster transcriptional repressor MraZ [Chloroflexia bacterium]